jgi:hypothetical protein
MEYWTIKGLRKAIFLFSVICDRAQENGIAGGATEQGGEQKQRMFGT